MLVIDACIARSAGDGTSADISSNACHRFLMYILDETNAEVVFSEELSKEWKKHRSNFATKWQRTMVAQGRSKFLNLSTLGSTEWADEFSKELSENHRAGFEKDAHLFILALNFDDRIASQDKKLVSLLHTASKKPPEIKRLLWLNPVTNDWQDWFCLENHKLRKFKTYSIIL